MQCGGRFSLFVIDGGCGIIAANSPLPLPPLPPPPSPPPPSFLLPFRISLSPSRPLQFDFSKARNRKRRRRRERKLIGSRSGADMEKKWATLDAAARRRTSAAEDKRSNLTSFVCWRYNGRFRKNNGVSCVPHSPSHWRNFHFL